MYHTLVEFERLGAVTIQLPEPHPEECSVHGLVVLFGDFKRQDRSQAKRIIGSIVNGCLQKNPTLLYFGGLDSVMNLLGVPEGSLCPVMAAIVSNYKRDFDVQVFRESFRVHARISEILLDTCKEGCALREKNGAELGATWPKQPSWRRRA